MYSTIHFQLYLMFTFSSIFFRSFIAWRKCLKLNLGLPSNEREICGRTCTLCHGFLPTIYTRIRLITAFLYEYSPYRAPQVSWKRPKILRYFCTLNYRNIEYCLYPVDKVYTAKTLIKTIVKSNLRSRGYNLYEEDVSLQWRLNWPKNPLSIR